jgi:hypothetical protein
MYDQGAYLPYQTQSTGQPQHGNNTTIDQIPILKTDFATKNFQTSHACTTSTTACFTD